MIRITHGLFAWTGLIAVFLFLVVNITYVAEGSGLLFLMVAVGSAAAIMLFRVDYASTIRLRKSSLFLLTFLVYFLYRVIVDFGDWNSIKSATIGTSGGVMFALGLGVIVAIFMQSLFAQRESRVTGSLPVFLFLGACLAGGIYAMSNHMANLRADIFLSGDIHGFYQRPGNFIIILTIIASMCLALRPPIHYRVIDLFSVIIYISIIMILLPLTQVIGSNAAFVVTAAIGSATLIWILLARSRTFASNSQRWSARIPVVDVTVKTFPVMVFHASWLIVASAALALAVVEKTGLSIRQFRIFGFDQARIGGGGLENRLAVMARGYFDQLSVSPVFGNMRADALTSGDGSYAHSIISMVSHLGIVGTVLFIIYLIAVAKEFRRGGSYLLPYMDELHLKFLKLLVFLVVIGFALVGTFFTWMPLWFTIALLFPPVVLAYRSPSRTDDPVS